MIKAQVIVFPRALRALPLLSLGAIGVLVAAPTVITVARDGHDLRLALIAAAVVGGAGLAYSVDDDAALVLAASPSTLRARRTARILAATLIAGLSWTAVLALGWSADLVAADRFDDLAIEAITAAGVAIAVAAWLHRELDMEHTGLVGAATAVVGMLFVTMLSTRYSWLPTLAEADQLDGWLWVAAIAWANVWWTARDPANRRHNE